VDRTPGPEALVRSASGKGTSPWTSRAQLTLDGDWLSVAVVNDVDAGHALTSGQTWAADDGVELALLLAPGASRQDAARPFVLRGYANGKFQSATVGGVSPAQAEQLAAGVRYTAARTGPGRWEARWRVPLAALGITTAENHLPLLAQIAVYRSAGKTWSTWSPQHARDTWIVRGAYALWLAPLGDLAFLPGTQASVARVAVSWGRDKVLMQAGPGATNPTWAPSGSRIEAQFGAIGADRWQTFQFEFTPAADGQVVIELMGTQGTPTAWTCYDDFRVDGATLVNGDFEQLGPDGRPKGWRLPKAADLPGAGLHMAIASHDFRTTQPVVVHKDQKVTVRFKARAALGLSTAKQ
jgi:hypothetical protein